MAGASVDDNMEAAPSEQTQSDNSMEPQRQTTPSVDSHGDDDHDMDLPDSPLNVSPANSAISSHISASHHNSSRLIPSEASCMEADEEELVEPDTFEDDDNESITSSTAQYCQEPFETFKLKVNQLCHEIGFGEPSNIERMQGGGFNRIIGLNFSSDRPAYILRIPRFALEPEENANIKNEVSVLLHLERSGSIPVASVVAFDSTTNNAIRSQYVVQQRIPGTSIHDIFYELPLPEKLEIATKVAEMMLKIESVTFDKHGRLASDEFPATSHLPIANAADIKVTGYRDHPYYDGPVLDKQPLIPFILALLEHRKKTYDGLPDLLEKCERLQAIALEMKSAGLVRAMDNDSVLWHWDLSAANMMVRRAGESDAPAIKVPDAAVVDSERQDKKFVNADTCNHTVQFKGAGSAEAGQHTINVTIDSATGMRCNHKVEVAIENSSGTTFRYEAQISNGSSTEVVTETAQNETHLNNAEEAAISEWVISGVLDWDEALAVPRVLARKPPSWLWLNEDDRPDWTGNRDRKPHRDLVGDELLVKAHFDQIMTKASPSYMEDAYGRGVWLRALAVYGMYPFEDGVYYDNFEEFVAGWDTYYGSLAL